LYKSNILAIHKQIIMPAWQTDVPAIGEAEAVESWVEVALPAAGIDNREPDCLWRTCIACMRCHNATVRHGTSIPPGLRR